MTEKFHYTLPDGRSIAVPRFENIPLGVIRRTRRLEQADQVFTLLEELLPETELALVDQLDRTGFERFMNAWRDGSQVELGESSASANS